MVLQGKKQKKTKRIQPCLIFSFISNLHSTCSFKYSQTREREPKMLYGTDETTGEVANIFLLYECFCGVDLCGRNIQNGVIAQKQEGRIGSETMGRDLPLNYETDYSYTSFLSAIYCTISSGLISFSASASGISKPAEQTRQTSPFLC